MDGDEDGGHGARRTHTCGRSGRCELLAARSSSASDHQRRATTPSAARSIVARGSCAVDAHQVGRVLLLQSRLPTRTHRRARSTCSEPSSGASSPTSSSSSRRSAPPLRLARSSTPAARRAPPVACTDRTRVRTSRTRPSASKRSARTASRGRLEPGVQLAEPVEPLRVRDGGIRGRGDGGRRAPLRPITRSWGAELGTLVEEPR